MRSVAEALDSLGLGFCLFDRNDRTLLWNPSFLRLFPEHEGEVFPGEPYAENLRRFYRARLTGPELGALEQCVAEGLERHRRQTKPFVFEHRGQFLRVTAWDVPEFGRARIWTPVAPLGGAGDVPFVAAPPAEDGDGRSLLGPDGRLESCNLALARLFGLPSAEAARGHTHRELVAAAWGDAPEGATVLQTLAEAERFVGVPFELPLPKGRWFRVLQQRLADGRVASGFADISATKRLQAELEEAGRAAQRANEAKDAFLAMAGHELRAPLGGLLALLSHLEEEGLPAGPAGRVALARQSAEAVLRVVDELLDFSQLEAGAIALHRAPLDPAALLGELAGQFGPVAARKGLDLRVEVEPSAPALVVADRARLRQVVANLVGAALSRTAAGEVSLRLSRRGGLLEIAVADTGPGLDPAALVRAFEPGTPADGPAAGRRTPGTGLGLSVCRRLARAMGGDIVASSSPGRGTRFALALPCELAKSARHLPAATLPSLPPARVLVVDDNAVNREVTRLLLERLGLRVATASGLGEALQAAAEPLDLVLMDLEMPGSDGLAVMAAMRRSGLPGGAAPFVAMTAHTDQERRRRCEEAGMRGYLVKPTEVRVLAEAVAEALGGAPPAPALDEERVASVAALLPGEKWDGLLQDFRAAAEAAVAGLEGADATRRAQAVHGLKGVAWNLGAQGLGDLAAELERLPGEAARARLPELREAVEASLAALRERRRAA